MHRFGPGCHRSGVRGGPRHEDALGDAIEHIAAVNAEEPHDVVHEQIEKAACTSGLRQRKKRADSKEEQLLDAIGTEAPRERRCRNGEDRDHRRDGDETRHRLVKNAIDAISPQALFLPEANQPAIQHRREQPAHDGYEQRARAQHRLIEPLPTEADEHEVRGKSGKRGSLREERPVFIGVRIRIPQRYRYRDVKREDAHGCRVRRVEHAPQPRRGIEELSIGLDRHVQENEAERSDEQHRDRQNEPLPYGLKRHDVFQACKPRIDPVEHSRPNSLFEEMRKPIGPLYP